MKHFNFSALIRNTAAVKHEAARAPKPAVGVRGPRGSYKKKLGN